MHSLKKCVFDVKTVMFVSRIKWKKESESFFDRRSNVEKPSGKSASPKFLFFCLETNLHRLMRKIADKATIHKDLHNRKFASRLLQNLFMLF